MADQPEIVVESFTQSQKEALVRALESLWIYSTGGHPEPKKWLNALRVELGMKEMKEAGDV